jgi:hypothetical protein
VLLTLALAAAIIFAAHPAPSFASLLDNWIEVNSVQFGGGALWDYMSCVDRVERR